jgi:hypothetical protein
MSGSGRGSRRTKWNSVLTDYEIEVLQGLVIPVTIPFQESWLVKYLSEYDRVVVPVNGRPDVCPNPQCHSYYAHDFRCQLVPF